MPGMYANDAWMSSFLAAAKSWDSTRCEGAPNVRKALASRRMNFFRLSKAGIQYITSDQQKETKRNETKEGGREAEREWREGKRKDGGVGRVTVGTVTHEHGYSQTETVNALASTAQRGLFLSRRSRRSSTAFGHRSKVWTLGA
jgi:hypothetical protein